RFGLGRAHAPLGTTVDRRRLERTGAHVPLGEHLVVATVGDDRPKGVPQGFPQLRLARRNRDAVVADLEAWRAHDLEVLAATRYLLVIGGDREVLQVGHGPPDIDRKSTRLNSSHQIISYA